MGDYLVKCSMGHEIVGRWLQEEVGKDWTKIAQVELLLERARQTPLNDHCLEGQEISLHIQGDEVLIEENVLGHGITMEQNSEFDFYDSESTATCVFEDFEQLIEQWKRFLTTA